MTLRKPARTVNSRVKPEKQLIMRLILPVYRHKSAIPYGFAGFGCMHVFIQQIAFAQQYCRIGLIAQIGALARKV
jgi:hypothetical protein